EAFQAALWISRSPPGGCSTVQWVEAAGSGTLSIAMLVNQRWLGRTLELGSLIQGVRLAANCRAVCGRSLGSAAVARASARSIAWQATSRCRSSAHRPRVSRMLRRVGACAVEYASMALLTLK